MSRATEWKNQARQERAKLTLERTRLLQRVGEIDQTLQTLGAVESMPDWGVDHLIERVKQRDRRGWFQPGI